MKIGFDVAQTCSQRAGCAWYADALVRALVDLAPEHHFLLYHQFGTWQNLDVSCGTHIVRPNVTETFTDITPAEAMRIWQSPAELVIKTGAPDIVHANCFQAPKVPGAKLIYTVYDVSFWTMPQFTTEVNRLICQRGMIEALANADGFVFISKSSHTEFDRALPGWLEENDRPWVVTPLAPRSVFHPGERPRGTSDPFWLAVGSLEPRKNYETLIDAFELYLQRSSQPARLHVAGGAGWKSAHIHERLQRLEARGLVRYLGYVPDEELAELMRSALGLVFPSWYEGFGLPVAEAIAAGCPVISSNSTSLPEAGGEAALYVPPDDAAGFADAMVRLESDHGWRREMVARTRRHADRLNWENTARLTLDFYSRLLGSCP